jgi:hypothetical protein
MLFYRLVEMQRQGLYDGSTRQAKHLPHLALVAESTERQGRPLPFEAVSSTPLHPACGGLILTIDGMTE